MSFLPIAILAYILNAGAILVDKILIRTTLPNPLIYTFYVNLLQLLVIFLIPFGFNFNWSQATFLAISSGLIGVLAFYTYFNGLKVNEASVVGPVVGTFNPLFALMLGGFFFGQILTTSQHTAFFVLVVGTIILTWNLWSKGLEQLNHRFLWLIASGFFFGLSYVLLRQAFLESSFLNGFIISRVAAGLFVLLFLLLPDIRRQIFSKKQNERITSKSTLILLGVGQVMGAVGVTLITFGISLANPALVNALFGIQYLVILVVSLILVKKHPHLLEEKLSKRAITQKVLGAIVISVGLYLLAK